MGSNVARHVVEGMQEHLLTIASIAIGAPKYSSCSRQHKTAKQQGPDGNPQFKASMPADQIATKRLTKDEQNPFRSVVSRVNRRSRPAGVTLRLEHAGCHDFTPACRV